MKHAETNRIVPGAKYAVLFIHGIVGTPNQFRNVIDLEGLVPDGFSVRNLCLPGHGLGVKEFAETSRREWGSYVRQAFQELARSHEKVIVVGHSMGTLFGLQLQLEFPEKIAGLFLLNVPLRPWVRLWGACNALRLAFGCVRIDRPREASILLACGTKPTPHIWRYIPWVPRFIDLFAEIIHTEKKLTEPQIPYIIIQSRKDELVSNLTAGELRKIGFHHVMELPESSHFYYPAPEKEEIQLVFWEMLCAISTKV